MLLGVAITSSLQAQSQTYNTWKQSRFTSEEQSNNAVSGETADPDRDGLLNLMEYALGRLPKSPEVAGNPVLTVTRDGSGELFVSFQRLLNTADLDYVVESSSDMQNWAGGFGQAWTTQRVAGASTETVTSQSLLASSSRQFIRLKVIRSPRAGILAAISTSNPATNNAPAHLLDLCTVKSGPYKDAIVRYPMRPGPHNGYEDPNYVVNWYLANILLTYFVETEQARVINYLNLYLTQMDELEPGQSTLRYRTRDVDLYTSDFSVWQKYHPDSDDAYAGTFLYLAGKYRRLYGETWFRNNKQKLKNIAYHNILSQIKGNGLAQVFQGGVSSNNSDSLDPQTNQYYATNTTGYLMDNVQAWAGLKELVDGLVADPSEPQTEINYFTGFRNSLEAAIHGQLWDSVNNHWKPADVTIEYRFNNVLYGHPPFYPFVQCQYFPELYDLPYASNPAETQRRYNLGWEWLEANTRTIAGSPTPWQSSGAWWSVDTFSHVDIAVVAAKRGEWVKVNTFLQMAAPRWLPSATTHTGTPCDQIGYWHALTSP